MTERYKPFPPRWGHVRVPMSTKGAALAGLTLYAPCRPVGLAVRRAAWVAVSFVGAAALPGRARHWRPPLTPPAWTELLRRWHDVLGEFDAMAVYERPQAHRQGIALLAIAGGVPVGFVKLRDGDRQPLLVEERALRALAGKSQRSFWAPAPLDAGDLDGWRYLVIEPLPARIDRLPSALDLRTLTRDIQHALNGALDSADVPEHWEPMHGDLTPWNLREVPGMGLVLVDWEEAGWGPPHADEVLYRAVHVALAGGAVSSQPLEAVSYWQQQVAGRPIAVADRAFHDRLLNVLRRMEEHALR